MSESEASGPERSLAQATLDTDSAESSPILPRFNCGAFLVPPLWGVAHGLWAGVFFLPLWAFVDNALRATSGRALWMQVLAWGTAAGTLAFQYEYGRTAYRLAWRKASKRTSIDAFVRGERLWAAGGAALVVALAVWIAVYVRR